MRARTVGTGALLASLALALVACSTPVTPMVRPSPAPSETTSLDTPPPAPAPLSSPPTHPTGSPMPTGDGSGVVAAGTQPADTVPITKLKAGERPPQFVMVSFDGMCRTALLQHYLDLGRATGARFTFFLSGLCLVPESKRTLYHPPHKPVGTSAIGFAEASRVPERIRLMTEAYEGGFEIGTHFLGHFWDKFGIGTWSQADWASELAQAKSFLDRWKEINAPQVQSLELPFDSGDWKGDRSPCLLGIRSNMYPVFAKAGFTYDASSDGTLVWPTRIAGYRMWEFPLQRIKVVGYGKSNLSMDYNLLYVQNGGKEQATEGQCASIE
jgi:hypothetical protein